MLKKLNTLFASLFAISLVYAHEGLGGGLLGGLSHPFFGLDHMLAMIAVGALSAQMGGRALWAVPASFVTVMFLGGVLGIFGLPLPFVEYAIAASVVILGLTILLERKMSEHIAMALVAFFAIFHGHAHGVEMPYAASALTYTLGFLVSTVTLHLIGLALGHYAIKSKSGGGALLRISGAIVALVGSYLLWG